METREKVYSILVVSATETFNAALRTVLPEFMYSPVVFEGSVNAARRTVSDREFDLVIVNSPLTDDSGIRFAVDLCESKNTVVLLVVRTELYSSARIKTSPHGVFVMSKPVSRTTVMMALDWMTATRERLRLLEKRTVSIEEKMQEIRAVNRAKWLLINQHGMSEPAAHRYIEKQAMDGCVSKKEIADTIIKTYS